MNRRNFIKLSALATAPLIFTRRLAGQAADSPANRINLAYIGVGGRGGRNIKSTLDLTGHQIVATCDCDIAKARRHAKVVNDHYAKKYNQPGYNSARAYQDFRDVLKRPDIDAVVISTGDHWHVPIAIYAIQSGKDVYVEKSLGLAVTWNFRLRQVAAQHNAVVQYGTQQRETPHFRHACELARNGYLGQLKHIDAWCQGLRGRNEHYPVASSSGERIKHIPVPGNLDYDMWLGPAPVSPYTNSRTSPGGAFHVYDNSIGFLGGWGAHPLDIAQWGKGPATPAPVRIEGTGSIPRAGLFDTVEGWDIRATYADGVELHFMDTYAAKPVVEKYRAFNENGDTFFGTEGWVSVDRRGIHYSDPKFATVAFKPTDTRLNPGVSNPKISNADRHMANFLDCIRTRAETVSPLKDAVQSDLISHLSDIAIRTGRPITWDTNNETIIGDEQAKRMLHRPLRSPWTL